LALVAPTTAHPTVGDIDPGHQPPRRGTYSTAAICEGEQ
jgi:hypothetical protein